MAFDRIQRAEYLDIAQDVISELCHNSRVFVASIEVTPIVEIRWTYDTDADRLAAGGFVAGDVGMTAYVTEDDTYWNLTATAPTWLQIEPNVAILPANSAVETLLAVRRDGNQSREYSFQTITQWHENGWAFPVNDSRFTGQEFNARKMPDESVELHFSQNFNAGEKVTATCITQHNYDLSNWNASTVLPDFMEGAVSSGVLYRCLRRLAVAGDEKAMASVQLIENEYIQGDLKMRRYTRMYIDERSVIVTQPLKWLGE